MKKIIRKAKGEWPAGPWMSEPDWVEFTTKNGEPGLIMRNQMGSLCGYVGVDSDHPFFEVDYNKCYMDVKEGDCLPLKEREPAYKERLMKPQPIEGSDVVIPAMSEYMAERIGDMCECRHKPESDLLVHGGVTFSGHRDTERFNQFTWWFGFDCGHACDVVPGLLKLVGLLTRDGREEYRNLAYVFEQCEWLAEQLAKVSDDSKSPSGYRPETLQS
jgi:hypothetical protein